MKRSRRAMLGKWWQIIASQDASGKSAAAYCRENGIGAASFFAWKRRLVGVWRRSREVKFIELKATGGGADAQRTAAIEVIVGRRRVLVRRGFDRELLAEVVGVLEQMEGIGGTA